MCIYIPYIYGICKSQSFKLFAFLPFPDHPNIIEAQEGKERNCP